MNKPRVQLHEVRAAKPPSKLDRARQRFGKAFSHEPGSTWRPSETPILTKWLQTRGQRSE